jgi:hypothetical protein
MMPQRLTAHARFSQAALLLLALTAAVCAASVTLPASAVAAPRSDSVLRGWLPWDPLIPETGEELGPTFAEPLWSLASVRSPGLFVALDPVTGRPTRPSEAQRRAFAVPLESEDALRAPVSPLIIERLPGGGEIVRLGGRFQVYSVARRDAKGHIVTDCSLDPTAARRLLSAPVPATRSLPSPAAPRREER